VILADTSIWIDHFRAGNSELQTQLANRNILIHSFIVAELALGSLRNRVQTLTYLDRLPQARVAQLGEVRQMIEARSLWSQGLGLIDAHLLASTFLNPPTLLWTKDKHLQSIAKSFGVLANLP
jgi:predicted nucleic acid-binding protein